MKKILSFLMVMLMGVTLAAGCKNEVCDECAAMTLDDLNAMLNDKENMNMNLANTVAIIPFNHVNGYDNEWKFYALINFRYSEATYVKYQVTYLSCTCRDANVNYWSTAYMELTTPLLGQNVRLQDLSFDQDGTGVYTAGFWGDSNPIHLESNPSEIVATYDKYIAADAATGYYIEDTTRVPEAGYYHPTLKNEFIGDLLIGRKVSEIANYNKMADMKTAGVMSQDLFDEFTGASVSTNNILRIIHAVAKYHQEQFYDAEGNRK